MNKVEKVINDIRNGNIINIQFIPFNEKQQQVERPFKLRQLNLVRGIMHLSV